MAWRRRIILREGPVNVTPGNRGAGVSLRILPGVRVGRGAAGGFYVTLTPLPGVSFTRQIGCR